MHLGVTGGTGYVGGFVVSEALAAGDRVTLLSRRPPAGPSIPGLAWAPYDLDAPAPRLPEGLDALVHAAFCHVAGRYRGGEGDDPAGFRRRNGAGSFRLLAAARAAGIRRALFLSSRAVFDGYPAGTGLSEDLPPWPTSLYGEVKAEVERTLARQSSRSFVGITLRATGIYGSARPGGWHKWRDLFADFAAGRPVAPRRGSEVHGRDLARALRLLLQAPEGVVAGRAFHVSDLMVDRHDLLGALAEASGIDRAPPPPATGPPPSLLRCDGLHRLGWRPGGEAALAGFLAETAATMAVGAC